MPIPAQSWWSAAMLGVLCTGLAFVMYYRLIQRIGAGRAVTVTYLVPLFGVAWAWLLLGEPLTLTMVIAGVLILGSVALSQRAREDARRRRAEARGVRFRDRVHQRRRNAGAGLPPGYRRRRHRRRALADYIVSDLRLLMVGPARILQQAHHRGSAQALPD